MLPAFFGAANARAHDPLPMWNAGQATDYAGAAQRRLYVDSSRLLRAKQRTFPDWGDALWRVRTSQTVEGRAGIVPTPRRESVNENLDAGTPPQLTISLGPDYFCSDDQGKFTYPSRVS